MNNNLLAKFEKLKKALADWLARHELDNDLHYYTIEQWRERKEEYHNDALIVIVFEGGLFNVLNAYCSSFDRLNEFDDLLTSFGFTYEMGHAWNLGLYAIEGYDFSQIDGSYRQKLRDERWKHKRKFILERAEFHCEDCGSTEVLEVHHCFYAYGHEPWEYPLDLLRCLCRPCHEKRPQVEKQMRALMATMTTDELNALYQYASQCIETTQ